MIRVISILLIFITFNSFSQNPVKNIFWNKPVIYNLEGKPLNLLYFSDAQYNLPDNFLPYYFERLPLGENFSEVKVMLENQIFEEFNPEELKNISGLESVNNEIIINSEISYQRKRPFLRISFIPIQKNPVTQKYEKLISFSYKLYDKVLKPYLKSSKTYPSESILSSGKWIKIRLSANGIYQLTYSDLLNMGLSNPQNVAVYGNAEGMLPFSNSTPCFNDLIENPVWLELGSDGIFNEGDYILFYGRGPVNYSYNSFYGRFEHTRHCYSDYYYYFVTDIGRTKLFETVSSSIN
ncbi:MAG: hypothetical protein HY738_04180, partial [Bacteroidia bacterium]|nr:hypothetical protein [Bacteroidia bacterium]